MGRTRILIAATLLCGLIISCGKKEEPIPEKTATVQGVRAETVNLSPVDEGHEAVGTVRSKTTTVLSSKSMGHVLAVHVREGDSVRKGQLLVDVDDRDSRAQLEKARAGLREAQEAQEEIDQNIRAAESARDGTEAQRELATATFRRYKTLLEQRSVSQQEFDEVQARLKVADAEVDRAGRMLQALLARKNQVRAKQEQAKADISAAEVYVGYGRILSPMDGIVVSKQAEVGLLAAPGVPLLTIEDNVRYRLEVSVEDSLLGKIGVGIPVQVVIDSLGPQEFPGRVGEIVPASDPGSRSSTVKIDLPGLTGKRGGEGSFRSGLYGRARFPVGQRRILKVPQKALVQSGQLMSVFTLDPSSIVRLRLVKTGKTYGDQVEVLSGLNDGDRIIVEGMEKVREGDQVQ